MKTPSVERINTALTSIRTTLKAHPEIKQRTADFLSGTLKGEGMSETEIGTMARIPKDIGEKAAAVLEAMKAAKAPELYAAPRASWSAVVRLALLLGLDQLEKKYPIRETQEAR